MFLSHNIALARSLDLALFDTVLDSAPDICSRSLILMPFPLVLLVCIFLTTCLQYWLGLLIFSESSRCSICHVSADRYGDHHVGCGGNGDRIFHHDSICDAVFSTAQSAALEPQKEFASLISGRQNHPADVFLPHWGRG